MIMGIDDFFAPVNPIPSSVTGPTPSSVAGPAPDSVTGPAPGCIPGPTRNPVIGSAPGIVTGRVAPVMINPTKGNYFYGKQVIAKEFTSTNYIWKERSRLEVFRLVRQVRHETICWVFWIIHKKLRWLKILAISLSSWQKRWKISTNNFVI